MVGDAEDGADGDAGRFMGLKVGHSARGGWSFISPAKRWPSLDEDGKVVI